MDVKRRWKSLSFKVEHLRLELEEREEHLRNLERQFMDELIKLEVEDLPGIPQKPLISGQPHQTKPSNETIAQAIEDQLKQQEQQEEKEEQVVESAEPGAGPAEMKKLWKKIATEAHPDKTKNNPEKTALYKKAAAAWKSKSYDELCKVAIELGIEPPDASEESIAVLTGVSSDLEKKLKDSETTILWLWGNTSPEKRLSIIDLYLRSRGKRRKQSNP